MRLTRANSAVRRRRLRRLQWVVAGVSVVGLGGLVVLLMWLTGFRRPEWAGMLSGFGATEKTAKTTRGDGLGKRDRAELGLTWQGAGKAAFGEFSVLSYDPVTRAHVLSEFRLTGETTCGSESAFHALLDGNRRFFREQVAVAVRNCDFEELTRDNLDLLGKKIVTQVNRALGRELLTKVSLGEFSVYESVDHGRFVLQEDEP